MAWTTVLNRSNYAVGPHTFGPIDLPVGVKQLNMRAARFERTGGGAIKQQTVWPDIRDALDNPQDVFRYSVEISFDGGATWDFRGGSTNVGGIINVSPGPGQPPEPLEWQTHNMSIREPENPNRKIRATLECYTTLNMLVQVDLIS